MIKNWYVTIIGYQMFILCNCDLAAPPPPTLWLRGGSALLLCRRWNTYFLWVISSIHSQPALCAWVTNLYEINQFPWKRIFLINPSMRLKASYLRPKKEKKLQTFPLRAISGKKKKNLQVITLLEQKATLWSHGKIIYLFSCGFVLVEFVFVLVQFVLIWFQDVYDEIFV